MVDSSCRAGPVRASVMSDLLKRFDLDATHDVVKVFVSVAGFYLGVVFLLRAAEPIIVEWERDARIRRALSRSVTHRYVTERYAFQSCGWESLMKNVTLVTNNDESQNERGPPNALRLSPLNYDRSPYAQNRE
ncbi:hypothetical protein EVAR_21999_1 [Eumeta japonica]|uniref:Uncharacterized protein n=1 Tax=Eumeta variegata TaxID=151549 RepID=A0A4C1YUV7_EUMVA|nr:hypothetical protein EVAR_21999_1 [Eumeta japonica]